MLKCKMIKPLAKIIVATGIIIGLLFPGITSFAEKTETVYVITQRSDERTDPVNYTYNPNGLIQSYTNTFEDQVVFKYQNGKLTKKADGKGHESKENTIYREEYLYNYNSRGWLMSSQRNSFETITTTGESTQSWEKYSFQYGKNCALKKSIWSDSYGRDNGTYFIYTSYDKNGRPLQIEKKQEGYTYISPNMYVCSYDKHGNLKELARPATKYSEKTALETYKFVYDGNGNAVNKTDKNGVTTTYQYKKMKVPAKLSDTIRQQQWEIVNSEHSIFVDWGRASYPEIKYIPVVW